MASPNYTAAEGIRMLHGGSTALKYGRAGKPHLTTFSLSSDRSMLSWRAKRTSFGPIPEAHSVKFEYVSHLLVGRESAVFKRFAYVGRQRSGNLSGDNYDDEDVLEDRALRVAAKRAPGKDHLSLSLQFAWLPGREKQRQTLDLSFEDEEAFGLWVAALRVLVPPHALGPDQRSMSEQQPVVEVDRRAEVPVPRRTSLTTLTPPLVSGPPPAQQPLHPRPTTSAKAELHALLFSEENESAAAPSAPWSRVQSSTESFEDFATGSGQAGGPLGGQRDPADRNPFDELRTSTHAANAATQGQGWLASTAPPKPLAPQLTPDAVWRANTSASNHHAMAAAAAPQPLTTQYVFGPTTPLPFDTFTDSLALPAPHGRPGPAPSQVGVAPLASVSSVGGAWGAPVNPFL